MPPVAAPKRLAGRYGAVAWLALLVLTGCGKSHGSGTTGPTASPTRNQDFGGNNPSTYSALGDSITLGVGAVNASYPTVLQSRLREVDPNAVVVNRGVAGELIDGGLARISGVLAADRPGFILILEGTNSLGQMPLVGDLREMVRRAKANKTIPLVGAITPQFGDNAGKNSLIAWTNAQIRAMTAQEGVTFVDLFEAVNDPRFFSEDGFHPNDDGYVAIADAWFVAILSVR